MHPGTFPFSGWSRSSGWHTKQFTWPAEWMAPESSRVCGQSVKRTVKVTGTPLRS